MRDFDRPLDARGLADAEAVGLTMAENGFVPEVTLCSSARRTRETLEKVTSNADTGRVVFSDALYSTDAGGYLAAIREHGAYGSVLVVGHNPMMEDLASAIAADGDPAAQALIAAGFPTAGLAVVDLPGSLGVAEPGTGYLERFIQPSDR